MELKMQYSNMSALLLDADLIKPLGGILDHVHYRYFTMYATWLSVSVLWCNYIKKKKVVYLKL